MKASLLHHCTDQTGEAATWLPSSGLLLWVDIDNGILHSYDPKRRLFSDHGFPELITSILPWKNHPSEIILTMKNRLIAYHLERKTFSTLAELPLLHPMLRTNDCKASPEGRLWCGVMHLNEHNATGSLLSLENDLTSSLVLTHQSIPNGMVWNRAGDRMYYADSGRGCIEEYAYDTLTGAICFLRTAIQVPGELGVPDGMTIDAEGLLWVAHWGGYGVYVWNPVTGKQMDYIEVPAPNVASCTFGGLNARKLYITTARSGLSPEELEKYPLSGSLFEVNVPGVTPGQNHYPFITS